MKIPWFSTYEDKQRHEENRRNKLANREKWHKFFAIWPRRVGGNRAVFLGYVARRRITHKEYVEDLLGPRTRRNSYIYKTIEEHIKDTMSEDKK